MKFKRGDRIICIKENNNFYLKTGTILTTDIWDSVVYFDDEIKGLDEKGIFSKGNSSRLSNNYIEFENDYQNEPVKTKWFGKNKNTNEN